MVLARQEPSKGRGGNLAALVDFPPRQTILVMCGFREVAAYCG